jgi:mycothiol synthase
MVPTVAAILPVGYSMRAPTAADAPAVAQLIAACELAETGTASMATEELLGDWKGMDLAENAVLVTAPGGGVAAYADLLHRSYVSVAVYGHVHPEHRGRGLGACLVRWGEEWTRSRMERAPTGARVEVRHYLRHSNEPARRLLESLGYAPVRAVYVMTAALDQAPPEPEWPEGIRARGFVPGQDERATFEAYEEASREMWGRPRGTFERWMEWMRHSDPTLLFIAEDPGRGEIAGVCACSAVAGRGDVGGLRVRQAWRRRGLGLALLRHAFGEFYRRGLREVRLSVDAASPTGAPRLYARAGMHVAESYVIHQKELRPGKDLGLQAGTG